MEHITIGKFNIEKYDKNIHIFKNFIDLSFCDECIKCIDSCNLYPIDYCVGNNVKGFEIELIKHSNNIENIIVNIYIKLIINILYKIHDYIFDEPPKYSDILARKITHETRLHYDGIVDFKELRLFSCIIALNDDYGNGFFEFPQYNLKKKLNKGDVLIFPPYWTHLHKVEKPLFNYRYTITFWLLDNLSENGNVLTD